MPPKRSADVATQRQQQRARWGRLQQHRILPKTSKTYYAACGAFLLWLAQYNVAPARSEVDLDQQVSEYLETLWETGAERNAAGFTLSGLQFFLRRRRFLHNSWRLLRVWQRLEHPSRAPPLPARTLLATVATACS